MKNANLTLKAEMACKSSVMHRVALGVVAAIGVVIGLSQTVLAADLPVKPAYTAPVLAPAPVYSWTGCYVGANIGGAWANFEVTDVNTGATTSPTSGGFAGGGQIGCDYQAGAWVIGFRNILDGTSLSNTSTFSDGGFSTAGSNTSWFDNLSARAGYLVLPNVLLYGQGGAAWSATTIRLFNGNGAQVGEFSKSKTGWTAGLGAEWMFAPHWSAFLEYNYMGFGTFSNAVSACAGATCSTFSGKADIQDVLVGVNYKF